MDEQEVVTKTPQQVIEETRAMILAHCKLEIDQVLEKHGCILTAIPQIIDGRIVAHAVIKLNGR